jgi:hypothetical protein
VRVSERDEEGILNAKHRNIKKNWYLEEIRWGFDGVPERERERERERIQANKIASSLHCTHTLYT